MRRNVGSEKNTAYGGLHRRPRELESILPPPTALPTEREPEETPSERSRERLPAPAIHDTQPDEPGEGLLTVAIDGVTVHVPAGSTIFQAAELAGYTPPHFCYHRDLSIPANCRMCLCEVEKQPKLQTSCSIAVADGMVVRFDSPRVREAVQQVMEFEFKNHPLDCPVCDQVGECYLQKYYIEVGRYVPLPITRVRKDKVKDVGPITIDAERCVLCSRCVRFGEEITGSGDFVIARRSDHAEIMTFDDRPVTTAYALNYTDICPVGALTSNDFRFRKRVYYLKTAKSVCPECSTGCNIYAEQAEDTVYRYRPRYNDQVNDSWMCDPGRLSYARLADKSDRLAEPLARAGGDPAPVTWIEGIARAVEALKAARGRVAAIASPRMSNEDLWALRTLLEAAGGGAVDFRLDDAWRGMDELADGILIRRDPNPNTRGALVILGLEESDPRAAEILRDTAGGALIVCDPDGLGLAETVLEGVSRAGWSCVVTARRTRLAGAADLVLPSATHLEREGTFTNGPGRVQRFWPIVPLYERSRPAWEILAAIRAGIGGPAAPTDAAAAFRELAHAVPAYEGLTYTGLGDQGMWLRGAEKDMPPVGVAPKPGIRAQQTY